MIELENVSVVFGNDEKKVEAVKHVNLKIAKGPIFGIVGYSGAGKSTLVRVINRLQRPTTGIVRIEDCVLNELNEKELRQKRKEIGMIFQHFNLLETRTIGENVSFPLKYNNISKEKQRAKVAELLKLVGLEDKVDAYPSQLSGGQKQRVAIARALASEPKILLCDEATSALDPKTTKQILELLQHLNRELKLTIVLITHEMQVVKEICHQAAVMSKGEIVEKGTVLQLFSKPQKKLTAEFIKTAFQQEEIISKLLQHTDLKADETLVELAYTGDITNEPLLIELYEKFRIIANVLYGNIEYLQETPMGKLIVSFKGSEANKTKGLAYLKSRGLKVRSLEITTLGV